MILCSKRNLNLGYRLLSSQTPSLSLNYYAGFFSCFELIPHINGG